jgi:hypothetical protein
MAGDTRYLARCRDCGAEGIEDGSDPAPGLCPTCYDRKMAAIAPFITEATSLDELRRLLKMAGMTETTITAAFAEYFPKEVQRGR